MNNLHYTVEIATVLTESIDTEVSTSHGLKPVSNSLPKTYLPLGPQLSCVENNSNYFATENHQITSNNLLTQSAQILNSEVLQSFDHVTNMIKQTSYQYVYENNTQPKKTGRKQRNSNIHSRTENKINRNSNKPYINYKGVEVKPRTYIDYDCKCSKSCSIRLPSSLRKLEFDKFWSLCSYNSQTAFICAKISEYPVKRRYGKIMNNAKSFSRSYCLCSVSVCRDMFLKTIQISSGRVNTALKKMRIKTSIDDQRGRNQRSQGNKIQPNVMKEQYEENNQFSTNQNLQHDITQDGIELNRLVTILDNNVNNSDKTCEPHLPLPISPVLEKSTENSNTILPNGNCYIGFSSNINKLMSLAISNDNCNIRATVDQPRKGRKLKYCQSRSQNKANRNNNKAYINYKGMLVQPKQFNDFCCKCSRKCSFLLPKSERLKQFEKFWALSYNSQTAFIVASVSEHPIKKRYSQESATKKDFIRKYSIGSLMVCRDLFCKTFNVSPGRINTALKKLRLQNDISDKRGIKQGGHNKLPAHKRHCVMRFMKRIPVYMWHQYEGKNKSRFLPPDLSVSKLYDLYKQEEKLNHITNASFKKIFYKTFNLRNREVLCQVCNYYNKNSRTEQGITNNELRSAYNKHIVNVSTAQKFFEYDMMLAKKYADIECITIRMGKNLPLPRMSSNLTWCKRLLWLYNFSVYSSKKDQSYCYLWPEGQGGKGCQEVGSCLLKHAKEEIAWFSEINHLIIWSEPHGGLMRNVRIALLLNTLLHSCPTLKSIKLKFVISGHSSFQNERDLTDIEKFLKSRNELYTVNEYINAITTCRKRRPITVKLVQNEDFFSTAQIEKQVSLNGFINWEEVFEVTMFAQDPFVLYFKKDFSSEHFKASMTMDSSRIENVTNLSQYLVSLWPLGKPITPSKLKDLKSILHLMPENVLHFYKNLQCGTTNDEDVDGFNDILDFTPELIRNNCM